MSVAQHKLIKHLILTGPRGNGEFCFQETQSFIKIRGKQNLLFSEVSVMKWFVITMAFFVVEKKQFEKPAEH